MEIFQTLKKKKKRKGENLGTKETDSRSICDLHKTNRSVGSHVLWILSVLWIHILVLTDIMLEGD